MKRKLKMPEDEKQNFKLVPEGERLFQIVDVIEKDNYPNNLFVKCEDVNENGASLLYNVSLDPDNQYFWLTKLFLKCIDEPHHGEVEIDSDYWVGRRFYGLVKHKDGYANIKKLIYKDMEQVKLSVSSDKPKEEELAWDEK